MNQLKVTDLFKDSGHNFNYVTRARDQELLIKRMYEHEELNDIAVSFAETCEDIGIVSLNYLDYFMEKLTKLCAEKNIMMV